MLVPKYDVVFANDPFTLMLFRERKVRTVEPPLHERSRLMATEVRRRMAEGGNWQELVPAPVAKAVKEIGGVERVKAVAQREHMRR
jgi:nicotinamide-nucleotide adenylyltransferase